MSASHSTRLYQMGANSERFLLCPLPPLFDHWNHRCLSYRIPTAEVSAEFSSLDTFCSLSISLLNFQCKRSWRNYPQIFADFVWKRLRYCLKSCIFLTNIHCSLSAERSVIIASVKVFFADVTRLRNFAGELLQRTGEMPVALVMRQRTASRSRRGYPARSRSRPQGRPPQALHGVLRSARDDRMAVQKQDSCKSFPIPARG